MKRMTAFDVADYFIYLSSKDKNRKISNKKLQKLVYYAQAWSLVLKKKPLFDEKIEAWIHGPAIPELYKKYKQFGFRPIESKNVKFNPNFFSDYAEILDEVWRIYGKYDANYLEILTHQEDPWIIARSNLEFEEPFNSEISLQSMKNYYAQKLNDSKKNDKA